MQKFILTFSLTILSLLSTLSITYAAKVRMTGMDEDLTGRMALLIEPRLEYIKKRSATEWRADDAAFFLYQLLVKEGYADSKVAVSYTHLTLPTIHLV